MTHTVSHLEGIITEFRKMLPVQSATAQAIDRHDSWDRIALNAVADGYIELADELGRFIEACVRRGVY